MMKQKIQALKQLARRGADKGAKLMLLPAVAIMCSPVYAGLPTMTAPGDGIGGVAVDDNNWLGQMGAWFKAGAAILGLILGALGFLYVVMGGLQKWKQYSAGRAEIGDLKEYFIMGAIMTVFMVVMINYAVETLA